MSGEKSNRRGRPATGKRGAFSFRITAKLRERLAEEAVRDHVSLSEIVERRLEQSVLSDDLLTQLFGPQDAVLLCKQISPAVQAATALSGRSWLKDPETLAAIKRQVDQVFVGLDTLVRSDRGGSDLVAKEEARHRTNVRRLSAWMDDPTSQPGHPETVE